MWSFNFFFYNKKMKRMVYLSCRAASKLSAEKEVRPGWGAAGRPLRGCHVVHASLHKARLPACLCACVIHVYIHAGACLHS